MEQVSRENYDRKKGQHTANATRISNEILIPPQENIPIFFIENSQMSEDDLQRLLTNTAFNEKTMEDYVERIKQKMKQARKLITTEKWKIDKTFNDYEEQRKKADEDTINEKKNEHIVYLMKMIRKMSYSENDIRSTSKNLIDMFQLFTNFCEIRQSGKELKICTNNFGDFEPSEETNPKNKEKNEILKKQLNNIIAELKKLWRTLNKDKRNEEMSDYYDGKSHYQSKSKDQSSSSMKGDYKNSYRNNDGNNDANNEEISDYIENQLNDIEDNFEEINKYSSEYRSFLAEYFQYIQNILNYLNIVWNGDLTRFSLKETPTFPATPDKSIKEINFIEIESFIVLLIFLLLIKIFLANIIAEKEYKYSALLRWIKWAGLSTDHHRENIGILNNNLTNMKFFDKFTQIKFIKCEIRTKSQSDSLERIILENRNKLNILDEAEEKINNLMEELDKII